MGRYSGKVLTLYITPSGVRVCEGENKNGNPDVTKFFVVRGVDNYFSNSTGGRAPEIINMSGLVHAIVSECKNRNTTAKRVMVCSDCFGIETNVVKGGDSFNFKTLLSGDIKNIGKQLSVGREEKLPDKMITNVSWGDVTLDGRVTPISTKTIGDKYLLKSMSDEFYGHGYEVIYVSGSNEVLMNFWQTEPASFDSQGKIILNYDVESKMTVFFKDVPVDIASTSIPPKDECLQRAMSQIRTALPQTGRNPHIYLTGSLFGDARYYSFVIDSLEAEGFKVYDLFNRPDIPDDYEYALERGDIDPVLTPDYSTNIAMFMCPFSKQAISMTPKPELSDSLKRNSKTLATVCLGLSVAVFAASVIAAGVRGFELYKMKKEPSQLDSLQSQVTSLTMRKQSLTSTIQTLTQADTTILELMKFVEDNQSDRVAVVSIDTRDMLEDSISVDTSGIEETEDPEIEGSAGGGTILREDIIIRGYARSGNEAVSYFNKLFNYGLSSDPVLNGVERYVLPNGDEAYVFEIEIGGGE